MGANKGFTLVELLIALALGLALSTAIMQVTLASVQSRQLLDAAARIQENGRFALGYLSKDLRTAGFMGCPNLARVPLNVIAKEPPDDLNFTPGGVLKGYDNVASGNAYSAVTGSDVVVIQRADPRMAGLTGNLDPNNANIQIDNNDAGLGPGDFVLITDCTHADLFEATTVSNNQNAGNQRFTVTHANNANDNNKLSKTYGEDAFLLGFQSVEYFVRNTGRTTAGGRPIHSLYVRERQFDSATPRVAQELVEGVQDMQLTYGEDGNGDRAVDSYKTASAISDWSKVLSVRIELLLHSLEDNVVSGGQLLTYNGAAVAQDGRLRKVYTTTVAVRNRLP
ncbi:type IV pilus assembly protein PilW [Litorivivens lipolytica]|uniref:Type IV pilus assembly protein PilW n=1 Tax=Litorivivens lipolytica TaxID=1524264 RepID=A0A7W4W7A1_9GAMM|nr:PilW family protein [Litorivivens lipolytica]MBB3048715.1 type IV pilus assembly protein PilW [Litorivivens lipolytica]